MFSQKASEINPMAEISSKQIQLQDFSEGIIFLPPESAPLLQVSPYSVRDATLDPAVIATMMSESSAARIRLTNGSDKMMMNLDQNRLATGELQAAAESELARNKIHTNNYKGNNIDLRVPISLEHRVDDRHHVEGKAPKVSYMPLSAPSAAKPGYEVNDYTSVYEHASVDGDYVISDYKSIYD